MSGARLLASRRFLPLFVTQFGGAFNDNLFRSAMLFLLAYRLSPEAAATAATVAGGLFILPYLLFSAMGGALADGRDKAALVRWVKLAEIALVAVGAAALLLPSTGLLFAVLFGFGVHSTLFGPTKYALLPQHLDAREIAAGTALVEAGTFLAILLGQIAGGLLGPRASVAVLAAMAVTGWLASRFVPPAPPTPGPMPDGRLIRGTAAILALAFGDRRLRHAVIGTSWFFALGAILTQEFVPLVASLDARPAVAALLLALFSIGVAAGSLAAGRLLRRREPREVAAPAALAVALLTAELAWTVNGLRPGGTVDGIAGFLRRPGAARLAADLVALAVAGGLYVVPLYQLLQTAARAHERARAVAANNVANAAVMVVLTLAALALLHAGVGIAGLFAALAAVGLAAAWSASRLPICRAPG